MKFPQRLSAGGTSRHEVALRRPCVPGSVTKTVYSYEIITKCNAFITLINIPFSKNLLETNFPHFFYIKGNNKKMPEMQMSG